jgi:hypothetical protein
VRRVWLPPRSTTSKITKPPQCHYPLLARHDHYQRPSAALDDAVQQPGPEQGLDRIQWAKLMKTPIRVATTIVLSLKRLLEYISPRVVVRCERQGERSKRCESAKASGGT